MCGIAGCFIFDGTSSGSHDTVAKMIGCLSHRGPDGEGLWCNEDRSVCLGHRRLAIIDLGVQGAQPMCSRNGRYSLSYNGEIYNFVEIRSALEKLGIEFKGYSDTEVLLLAIQEWGVECTLDRIVGMFAFALWDSQTKKLYLVRDRAGKKPLYYLDNRGQLLFASELKSFRSVPGLQLSISTTAIYHYLSLSYVPAPMTVYKEIKEIPPGHVMVWDKCGHSETRSYWQTFFGTGPRLSLEEAAETADHYLNEAVKIRLRADVPVGVFLSGGIDSGLITAIAARNSTLPVKTFSATFGDSQFDESALARQVAERYGTDHHELRLSPKLDDLLPRVARAFDEPFGDPSAVPTYAISEAAAQHVKVILNGEGSDELFGGYRRHYAVKLFDQITPLVKLLPHSVWRELHAMLPQPKGFRSRYAFIYRFLRGFGVTQYQRYLLWGADGFEEEEKQLLFGGDIPIQPTSEYLASHFMALPEDNTLHHFMALDFLSGMADVLLVKMDIATMAHSLEARSPFLDHRLINWANSLDRRDMLRGWQTKPVLRYLAKCYLPDDIVYAPKRGFELPVVEWMRGSLRDLVHDACLNKKSIILDMFENNWVRELLEGRLPMDHERRAKRCWLLLMLALWDWYCR